MRVIFFGDSICNGQGVAIHKGWVIRLSAHLEEIARQSGEEMVVANAAINGRTTRQALEHIAEVQQFGADMLIVQFGMNDCNIWQTDRGNARVSPQAFEANLREIIDRAITFGARIIFLNTNHSSGRDQVPLANAEVTYEEQNRHYNQIIRKVAQSDPRVLLNDMETAFQDHCRGDRKKLLTLILPDLLHLSEEGHLLYFQILAPRIAAAFEHLLEGRKHAA